MTTNENLIANMTGFDVVFFNDLVDDRIEQARDWSPVPAEYQGMGHQDVWADLDEFYSEQALAEWEMNLLYYNRPRGY
jgi:hypothetical protein